MLGRLGKQQPQAVAEWPRRRAARNTTAEEMNSEDPTAEERNSEDPTSEERNCKDLPNKNIIKDSTSKEISKDLTKKSSKDLTSKNIIKDPSSKKSSKDLTSKNIFKNLTSKKSSKDPTGKKRVSEDPAEPGTSEKKMKLNIEVSDPDLGRLDLSTVQQTSPSGGSRMAEPGEQWRSEDPTTEEQSSNDPTDETISENPADPSPHKKKMKLNHIEVSDSGLLGRPQLYPSYGSRMTEPHKKRSSEDPTAEERNGNDLTAARISEDPADPSPRKKKMKMNNIEVSDPDLESDGTMRVKKTAMGSVSVDDSPISSDVKTKGSDSTMRLKKAPKRAVSLDEKLVSSDFKKTKVTHTSHGVVGGMVLAFGQGDVGQLGLGENVIERKRPALVPLPEKIVQAVAGGMHTVCLSDTGNIYTFGCNDEGALGRNTSEEGSETVPVKVDLPEKVVQISAGDSHTAALTEDGRVFLIGSFRDNNGVIGLLEPMKKSMVPVQVQLDVPVMKISSGNDHLVMLTVDGDLYTSGCGEQGQLGRVPERFTNRGGRKGLERLLIPQCIHMKVKGSGRVLFQDVFCGAYFTFAISREGHVYGFGLANYHQLGTKSTNSCYAPVNLTAFKNSTKSWIEFSGGQHHTVCLDSEGKAYSLGRAEYGRLGLGKDAEEKSEPSVIQGLPSVSSVACGASVSYAVTRDGRVFSWGMGTNYQLGTGEEDDEWSPVAVSGQQLQNRVVLSVSSGGQHTVLLVCDKEEQS